MKPENISYEQIDALFEELGYGIASDPQWGGNDIVFTAGTLEDFAEAARTSWAECGRITEGEEGGYRYWMAERVQPAKGQPRRDVIVFDLGDIRAAYGKN